MVCKGKHPGELRPPPLGKGLHPPGRSHQAEATAGKLRRLGSQQTNKQPSCQNRVSSRRLVAPGGIVLKIKLPRHHPWSRRPGIGTNQDAHRRPKTYIRCSAARQMFRHLAGTNERVTWHGDNESKWGGGLPVGHLDR
jgi:hypothetical protein